MMFECDYCQKFFKAEELIYCKEQGKSFCQECTDRLEAKFEQTTEGGQNEEGN